MTETNRNEKERKVQERMEEEGKIGGGGRGKGGAKERKRVREGRNWCDTVNSCSLMELFLEIQS